MAPLQLSMISDRFEIVLGAVQSTITLRSRHGHNVASKVQVQWRSHRPYIQEMAAQPKQNKRRIADLDRESLSIEGKDGSETLVSGGVFQPYYALSPSPTTLAMPREPAYVFTGDEKILPNIADFNCDVEGTSDTDTDTSYSHEKTQPNSLADLEASASAPLAARNMHPTPKATNPSRELIECVTALSPPPLHHSGRTRSEVVSIPRDSPGTCHVHGCGNCGLCDSTKPFVFTI